MKTFLKRLIPGLLLFSVLGSSALAQMRIATVDIGKAFTNYWRFKQDSATFDQRKADLAKAEKDMIDAFQKSKDDYQKLLADANNQAVSAEEREKRAKAAEDKLKELKQTDDDIRQFETQARQTLSDQVNRMRDKLVNEIREVVKSKAIAGNYNLVLDTTPQSSGLPIVLYNTGETDLTDAVLKQLNANAPAEPSASPQTQPAPATGKK